MKKMLLGLLIALSGSGMMFVQGKSKYKQLSEYPAGSVLKRKCHNTNKLWYPKRIVRQSACDKVDKALDQLNDILVDTAENSKLRNQLAAYWNNESDLMSAKIEKDLAEVLKAAMVPAMLIIAGESKNTINKEQEILQEYIEKRSSEIQNEIGWF